MIKIVTIIGARPQIIKAAALNRTISKKYSENIREIIVHTGQHYDNNMSQVFFDQMNIPKPDYNLNIGSGSHGAQTAKMTEGIENVLIKEKPDCMVLYGDTNSTLAGAIAASKMKVPIAHIEAGLRSFNKNMPEEINRILCDHVSSLLFVPTTTGLKNLEKEGFNRDAAYPYHINNPGVFHSGDVMYDNALFFTNLASKQSKILSDLHLDQKPYYLATIHRDNNTDIFERLEKIVHALNFIADVSGKTIVLPVHPRTKNILNQRKSFKTIQKFLNNRGIKIIAPVSFFDMVKLENEAEIIFTDSGGVQKEAFFYKKPCVILRPETEWKELVENGNARLCDADSEKIISAWKYYAELKRPLTYSDFYGNGKATHFICEVLLKNFKDANKVS